MDRQEMKVPGNKSCTGQKFQGFIGNFLLIGVNRPGSEMTRY